MLFLIELDHVKSGNPLSSEQGRDFIEQVIFPTLARTEKLAAEGNIVSGGAIAGRIALRFIVKADSLAEVDGMVSSLPIWPLAETRVTPLVSTSERRASVQTLLRELTAA